MMPVRQQSVAVVGLAGKCLDDYNNQDIDGNRIQLWTCNGLPSQVWTRYPDGTVRINNKCVDIYGGGTANTTRVQLWQCHGGPNQIWVPYNNGWRNPASGRCLDVVAANPADGAEVQIYDCLGTANQVWTVPTLTQPMISLSTVTDNAWHYAVLTAGATGQTLYVDGVVQGTITGPPVEHRDAAFASLGNGKAGSGWPAGPPSAGLAAGNFAFTGNLDDVAFYRHALTSAQVAEHRNARAGSKRLQTITEPGSVVAASLTYDGVTGRVNTEVDRHGATWTLSEPTLTAQRREVSVRSTKRDTVTYRYDTTNGGRVATRIDALGTTSQEYDEKGFLAKSVDANGNATTYVNDDHGNATEVTTCRLPGSPPTDCHTTYNGYYIDALDPFDPRNDQQIWTSDARATGAADTSHRITRTLDTAGRIRQITYPVPAGQTLNPTETFNFSQPYSMTKSTGPFISAGTVVDMAGDDDAVSWMPLPFSVPFFGEEMDQIWVSNDGYLSFSDLDTWPWPFEQSAPDPGLPNNVLMPFMDDFIIDGETSQVRTASMGTAPNRQFIVEWRDAEAVGEPDGTPTFEVIMSENGTIQFRYSGTDPDSAREKGSRATIGIENEAGTSAVMYSHNEESIVDETIITFTPTLSNVPSGLLVSHTATNGGVTTNDYNAAGDIVKMTDEVGLVSTMTYDALGRMKTRTRSATVDGSAKSYGTTNFTYNSLSQPDTVTSPGVTNPITSVVHTPVVTMLYDSYGRTRGQSVSDSTGGDTSRTTTWTYDSRGRLATSTAADNTLTQQDWDEAGDVIRTTQANGLVVEMDYDDAHRLISTTAKGAGVDPMSSSEELVIERRAYDPAGRLAAVVDAMQRVTRYAYYADGLLKTVTKERDPEPDIVTEQYVYDAAGRPTEVKAAGGVPTAYAYDDAGNVATRTLDPAGLHRQTTISYYPDSSPRETTSTGAASPGRVERTGYTYDLAGRGLTTTVTNTGGSPATLTNTLVRDPRGLVTKGSDATGIETKYTYDDAGNAITMTGAARSVWANGTETTGVVPVTTLGHNTFSEATENRDPNGQTTVTRYDVMGRPDKVTLPTYTPPGGSAINAIASATYNESGLVATQTDPLGGVTTLSYDKYGRMVTKTAPDPDAAGPKTAPTWTYTYSRNGEPLTATDPAQVQQRATYDQVGRQVTATVSERDGGSTPNYLTTTLDYNDAGLLTSMKTPLGHITNVSYNAAGEPLRATDPTGRFRQVSYDLVGRVVSSVAGQGTTYANPVKTSTYDLAGRVTAESDCTANAQGGCASTLSTGTFSYDAAGRTTLATSPAGRPVSYGYDTAGQLRTVTQQAVPGTTSTAISVQLGYDRDGNKTRMVDGNLNATAYTYNSWGMPESVIEPATTAHPNATDRTWTNVYNANGLLAEERLPGGVTRTSTYDRLGRLTAETGTGAEATTTARSLDYDALGRLVSATSPAGNHTYTYNDRGLLTASTGYGGGATFGYNSDGLLSTRTDGAGAATFGFDDAGRITSTVDPLTGTTATNTYDEAGRLKTTGFGTGNVNRTYAYEPSGRLDTDILRKTDGMIVSSADYGYDADGLLTSKITTGYTGSGTNSYTYDGLGRLKTWTGAAATSYAYDNASNRITVTTPNGVRTSTFDQRNRILTSSGAGQPTDTYTWQPRGTLASKTSGTTTTSYSYDAFERLTQAQQGSAFTITYSYDSLDRLAKRNTESFGYADLTNDAVLTPNSTAESKILRMPDGTPLSTKAGTDPGTTLVSDSLHNDATVSANPTNGSVSATATYDPWGASTTTTGTLPLGYQGGWTDPTTGLVNAQSRWYNPATGTFTSRDTWALPPIPTPGTNRYLYANASPLNARDNDGHRPICDEAPVRYCTDQEINGGLQLSNEELQAAENQKKNEQQGKTKTLTCDHPYEYWETMDWTGQYWSDDCKKIFNLTRGCDLACKKLANEHDTVGHTLFLIAKHVAGLAAGAIATTACEAALVTSTGGMGVVASSFCWAAGGGAGAVVDYLFNTDQENWTAQGILHAFLVGAAIGLTFKVAGEVLGALFSWIRRFFKVKIDDVPPIPKDQVAPDSTPTGKTPAETGGKTPTETPGGKTSGDTTPPKLNEEPPGSPGGGKTPSEQPPSPQSPKPSESGTTPKPAEPAKLEPEKVDCHSFDPATLVLMADGTTKPIKDVQVGDKVVATDPETGDTSDRPVIELHNNQDTDLTDVTTRDRNGTEHTVKTTQHHLFWDSTHRTWVEAGLLAAGTTLSGPDGETQTVVENKNFTSQREMRDLTVDGVHTYYVIAGNTPVLVHNCDFANNQPQNWADELADMEPERRV
jgi:RHS repeat-associated protein